MSTNDAATLAEVSHIRAKIAARTELCSPDCKGWDVFNAGEPRCELQSCDDCWHDSADPLTDDEVELLPEAKYELAVALEDGPTYERPTVLASCGCGCVVFSVSYHLETCCGCHKTRGRTVQTTELHPAVYKSVVGGPIFVKALAAMDSAEELNGPEGDDYVRLMQAIEDEARGRRERYESARAIATRVESEKR